MAEDQRKLAEGAANDAILCVQRLAKVLSNARLAKKADGSGQAYQTRATASETEIAFKLDLAIKDYNDLRKLLMKLGLTDDDSVYKPLSLADTYRKPTATNRNLGDTYRNDGPLWAANSGVTAGARAPTGSQVSVSSEVATQTTKATKRECLLSAIRKCITFNCSSGRETTTSTRHAKKRKIESNNSADTRQIEGKCEILIIDHTLF